MSLALAACGGQQPDPAAEPEAPPDSLIVAATPDEIQAELEILGYEIADLEAWIASRPAVGTPPAGEDPAELLSQATAARAEAERLAAEGDHEAAAESLSAGMRHVEQVKRALGLAEEWGEEIVD